MTVDLSFSNSFAILGNFFMDTLSQMLTDADLLVCFCVCVCGDCSRAMPHIKSYVRYHDQCLA
jgi:hypothetical protein